MALSVDTLSDSKALAQKLELSFPILVDDERALTKQFGLYDPGNDISWPGVYVIQPSGTITWFKTLDGYKTRPPIADILAAIEAGSKADAPAPR